MVIEIRSVGFVNKGAELMLYAIMERLREEFPRAVFAMAPTVSTAGAPYLKRAQLGFYQRAKVWREGSRVNSIAGLIPKKIRDMYGLVLESEVDIVLDAAGFAYSDQWGENSCSELAKSCGKWRKNGVKVVLLPQAFGPFERERNRRDIEKAASCADLIFAREQSSYDYLVGATGRRKNIQISPDFTNLLDGVAPASFDSSSCQFCIVPNHRMLSSTERKVGEAYLPFMIEAVRYAFQKDQKPFLLVHEGERDAVLARQIRDAVSEDIPILVEDHPLVIKGIIGMSRGSLGSRFHGLVSALSQGVPSLGTSWSHKYKELFNDYGFPEGLLRVNSSDKDLHSKLDIIFNPSSRRDVEEALKRNSSRLKLQAEKMWRDVFDAL